METDISVSFVVPYEINPTLIRTIPSGLDVVSSKNRTTKLTKLTITNASKNRVNFEKVVILQ